MGNLSAAAVKIERPKNANGEAAAKQVTARWTGDYVADACAAAFEIGTIHSGVWLSDDRAREIVLEEFNLRKIDDLHWSSVHAAFLNGRDSVVTTAHLKQRYFPAVVASNDNQPQSLQLPEQVRAAMKDRFQVTWFDDVNKSPAKEWIVKDIIGAGEFSLWVAKPGTAKSVLLCDIGCHIAAGKEWHQRKVNPGLVVFFAAERKSLTERRIAAWRKTHDVTGIPFAVAGGKLDLTGGPIDAKSLAFTIKALEEKCGLPCRLVILDTVTRTFGAGDQNSSKDMARFIQSADELTRATGAHVAAIHHSGWGNDRGKGAIDLDGAVDVSYGIDVLGTGPAKIFTLKCTGSNDGPDDGPVTSFRLDGVELGKDADGNVTHAPVVVQVDGAKQNGSNFKGHTAKALDALKATIYEHGTSPPDGSPGFPEGVVTASRDQWREQYLTATKVKEPNILERTFSQRFLRARTELIDAEQVGATGERCWITAT